MAGPPVALPKIADAIGTWLIPAEILLALGGLIGYLVSFEQEPAGRKVLTLGTGQRNLGAAHWPASWAPTLSQFQAVRWLVLALSLAGAVWLMAGAGILAPNRIRLRNRVR